MEEGANLKMKKQEFSAGLLVSYWHPTKGGWYAASIETYGRKHAQLRALVPSMVLRCR